jgi:tRNA pseudouridine32 synthase / 23S rRNA pseudouridine746 synthase
MTPEGIECRVLYRDALMIVLDKPAGVAVHRGPKGGESLEDQFDRLRFGLPRSPALAHRLDRDTSGCLVLGRHRKALAHLGVLFKRGHIAKTYWAVVERGPEADEGEIAMPLGRLDPTRGWWMKPDSGGQPAVTTWRVLGRCRGARQQPERPDRGQASPGDTDLAWLALVPLTGRTHQLRVHCAALGFPIIGDAIYGASRDGPSLHLHAVEIAVPLYPRREPVRVTAPVPLHMRERLAACGWGETATEEMVRP